MTRAWKTTRVVAAAWTLAGCGDDGGSSATTGSGTAQTSAPTGSPATAGDDSTVGDVDGSSGAGSSDSVPPGDTIYEEQFEGADGEPWPDPWQVVGTQLISAQLDGGRAQFSGNTAEVARMALPGFSETDIDVVFTLTYDDYYSQGMGFYVRQNGGALQQTDPPGEGYAIYLEGGYMQNFGVWREVNGVEEPVLETNVTGMALENDTPYRIRFQCFTEGSQTRLRGRLWPQGESEPGGWLVDTLDATPSLQGTAGAFAVDIYNYAGTASVYIDDVTITQLDPG